MHCNSGKVWYTKVQRQRKMILWITLLQHSQFLLAVSQEFAYPARRSTVQLRRSEWPYCVDTECGLCIGHRPWLFEWATNSQHTKSIGYITTAGRLQATRLFCASSLTTKLPKPIYHLHRRATFGRNPKKVPSLQYAIPGKDQSSNVLFRQLPNITRARKALHN